MWKYVLLAYSIIVRFKKAYIFNVNANPENGPIQLLLAMFSIQIWIKSLHYNGNSTRALDYNKKCNNMSLVICVTKN